MTNLNKWLHIKVLQNKVLWGQNDIFKIMIKEFILINSQNSLAWAPLITNMFHIYV